MSRLTLVVMASLSFGLAAMAQTTRTPDLEAQRAAMKKLGFLIGKWSGKASLLVAQGQYAELAQTEEAQFKVDGLVLMIEGVGRPVSEAKSAGIQALGVISFDDESGSYTCGPSTTDAGSNLMSN